MTLKLTNGFNRISDADLRNRATQIVTAMTDNPHFPTPTPSVDAVREILDAYDDALDHCSEADRVKIAIKNQRRKTLENVLHTWGLFVLLNCDNDIAIAMSSGFNIAKTPSPAPPITKPVAPVLESGINPGDLVSKGKPERGALVYLHQYATEAEMQLDQWKSQPSSKSTTVLKNLVPGTKYYCRIAVVGRKDQLVFSDVVSRIAA